MKTIDKNHIYRVIAGNPNEEDENKLFLSQDITFEEADVIFTSLLEKRQYPVMVLDEGEITIRGFIAPDRHEKEERYMVLKETAYRKANPDYKPLYVLFAYKNYNQDTPNTNITRTVHKLLESDDFNTAFSAYRDFVDRFANKNIPYDGIELIDHNSLRLLDNTNIVRQNPEKLIKPKRKNGKIRSMPGTERFVVW